MNVKKILILSATLLLTSTSFAKNKSVEKWKNMSKEDRAKMAEAHTKMADCLKSDKDMTECHKEMMDTCQNMEGACPMMGQGMMTGKGKGMMKKMKQTEEKKEEKKE